MGAWIERDLDIEVPADPVDLDTAVYSGTGGVQVTHERAASQVGQCHWRKTCLLYTSPSPRDLSTSRMPFFG